jgi:transposase InsO family protein
MEDREYKIRFVARKMAEGEWSRHTIDSVGISRRTYFYWKHVIENQGIDTLINKTKPGPKPSFSISKELENRVLQWRKRYGWGPTRIEGHLRTHYSIHYPHTRIYQLIVNKGLNEPITSKRRTWGKKRWERDHSMSLWQADWKDIRTEPGPMITYIDDHSRFIVGSKRYDNADTHNSIGLLKQAMKRYGKPEQILTDNGAQFANNQSDCPSTFTTFCLDNGIDHIRTSKKRPTTTGKIEAFHGCYEREAWRFKSHEAYIRHWNHSRPNGAIGYLYPVEVFYRDIKGSAIN